MDEYNDIMTYETMMDTRMAAACLLRVYYPLAALFTYSSLSCISYLIYYGFGGVRSFTLKKRPVFPVVHNYAVDIRRLVAYLM